MNLLMVSGFLGKDAELRYTQEGNPVLEFSIAVKDHWTKDKETLWIKCVCFGKMAEALHKFLLKGKEILATGRLTVQVNKTEEKTYTNISIICSAVEFMGKKDKSDETPGHADGI